MTTNSDPQRNKKSKGLMMRRSDFDRAFSQKKRCKSRDNKSERLILDCDVYLFVCLIMIMMSQLPMSQGNKMIKCHLFKIPILFLPSRLSFTHPVLSPYPMIISSHSSSRDFPCVLLRTLEGRALGTAAA